MAEFLELLGDGSDDFRVAVPGRADRDAGAEVYITLAFHVPDFGTQRVVDVDLGDIALAAGDGVVLAGLPVAVGQSLEFVDF